MNGITFRTVDTSPRGGLRIYRDRDQRRKDVARLQRRGFNYFVPFRDVNGPALQWAKTDWGYVHIDGNVTEGDRLTHGADGSL